MKLGVILLNFGGVHFAQDFLPVTHFRVLLIQEGHIDIVPRVSIVNELVIRASGLVSEELREVILYLAVVHVPGE